MLIVDSLKRVPFRMKSTLDQMARRCDVHVLVINLDSTLVQRINSPSGQQRHKLEGNGARGKSVVYISAYFRRLVSAYALRPISNNHEKWCKCV